MYQAPLKTVTENGTTVKTGLPLKKLMGHGSGFFMASSIVKMGPQWNIMTEPKNGGWTANFSKHRKKPNLKME